MPSGVDPSAGSGGLRRATLLTALTVAYGAVAPRLPERARVPANVVAAAGAVALARAWGASDSDLGLEARRAARGLAAGSAVALGVAGLVGWATRVPALQALFADERVTGVSPRRAAFEMAVRIPLGTAVAEELLFRSALLAVVRSATATGPAVAWSSAAFGVWHVLPALEAHASNGAGVGMLRATTGPRAHVAGTVFATAAIGVALAALRLRTRSVIAPVVAHAAVNAIGFFAARRVALRAPPLGRRPQP